MHPHDRTSDERGAADGGVLGQLLSGGVRRCRSTAELTRQSQQRVEAAHRRRLESQERLAAARRIGVSSRVPTARASRVESRDDNVIPLRRAATTHTPLVRRLLWDLGEEGTAAFAEMLLDTFDLDDEAAMLAAFAELRRWVAARHK